MKATWTRALIALVVTLATACETRSVQETAAQQPRSVEASQVAVAQALVDSLVSAEALERGVPGLAVAIVVDGEIVRIAQVLGVPPQDFDAI